jgi:hypothetical protein
MKIIQVKEWLLIEQKSETKKPEFSVVIADKDVSSKPMQIRLPYSSITDTTITPETHDLFITADKLKSNTRKLNKNSVFFREKTITEEGGVPNSSNFSNTPIGSTFGSRISTNRKALIDSATGDSVTVGEGGCAIGAQGRELLVGKNGVTFLSGSPTIPSLPETDSLIIKENGLGALMPRCFVPPFCMPRFLPNLQFLAQLAGTITLFKAISDIQKE